jgi:hypothetical protein
METRTIIETTKQEIKSNGVYDLTITSIDDNVIAVKADITAQIRKEDGMGGYILSAKIGSIEKNEKGTTITGEIPSEMLPNIISEFNEIIEEFKKN